MSQTMLPPSIPPDPRMPPLGSVAVVDAVPPDARPASPHVQSDLPRRPSLFWRVVKWPLRQFIKAVYLTGSAANRHRVVALLLVLVLLLLGGGTYAIYQYTHPPVRPSAQQQGSGTLGTLSNGQDTPFTIVNSSVPLSTGVINFLNAWKTGNIQELQANTEAQVQAGGTIFNGQQGTLSAADWPGLMQYFQSHEVVFQQFIYGGGFNHVDGSASYTIQVIVGFKGQPGVAEWTWYLTTGTDGKVTGWQDLTPAPQASPTP